MKNIQCFESLCRESGLFPFTPEVKIHLSKYLGLSIRQVERYISGASIHPCVVRLLEVRKNGIADLDHWNGFKIDQRRDELINPNGEIWHLSELRCKTLFLAH